ncbi:MAG: hypothetical protein IT379_23755 [Deltaproteobacteria bacterium]|nr:hypothetical protein [Deltaproteobacteria bacterium]
MSDLESEIAALLKPVIGQLAALFNRHTAATFARAAKLSGPAAGAAPAKAKAPAAAPKAAKAKAAKAAPAAKPGRKRGGGGGSANLEAALLSHIQSNPGARMEEISRVIGVPTKKLQGPAAKLLAAGSVRREGETRATKYFPADGGSAPAPAAPAAESAPKGKGKKGPKKSKG